MSACTDSTPARSAISSPLVEMKYREMTKARDQFDTLAGARARSRERARADGRRSARASATTLEVVNAQVQLSKVRIDRAQAGLPVDVALAELLEASGQSERFDEFRRRGEEVREP